MKLFDVNNTIMIVVGSGVPQEMNHRPLAYGLKDEIDSRGDPSKWRHAVVVSDLAYEGDPVVQECPTISIGNMASNSVPARLSRVLPTALAAEKKSFIQLDITYRDHRVLLWGIDLPATEKAVRLFATKGYLEKYLKHVWRW